MKTKIIALTLSLLGFCLPVTGFGAFDEDMQMVGLAMHQETGRNIFLGALYSDDPAARISNLEQGSGTGVLEHRVVARRTSVRSLLGKLLLQGEVATGKPPGPDTVMFVDDILSLVRGSLYAGDSLTIELTPEATTEASLNGHGLAVSGNQSVFYYFLSAWVGEKGPSTAFRSAILSPSIDSGLMTVYSANDASADRRDEVAGWLRQIEEDSVASLDAPTPAGEASAEPVEEEQASDSVAATAEPDSREKDIATAVAAGAAAAVAASTAGLTAAEPVTVEVPAVEQVAQVAQEAEAEPAVEIAEVAEPAVQLALAAPAAGGIPPVREIDAMDYSRQLGVFNNDIIRRVYSEIRYPRAAVRRSLEGSLELDITLDRSGALVGIEVGQSSGYAMLDKSAMTAATKAFEKKGAGEITAVAIAEYGDREDGLVVVPVPVSFILTQ